MFAVTYQLRLMQPLIVAMLDPGDENAARSLNYVPGSVMRGALAMRYIANRKLDNNIAAQDPLCHALFFGDETLFLDCLPADADGLRAKPTPLSWFAEKEALAAWKAKNDDAESLGLVDGALDGQSLMRMRDAKPISGEGKFCQIAENTASLIATQRETATHISRPHKRSNIKAKTERAIFTYESLSADQIFCGVVLANDEARAKVIAALLASNADVILGKSRSAGYGHARIEAVSQPIANWAEAGTGAQSIEPVETQDEKGEIVDGYAITLLSHALLRDENGQFSIDPGPQIGALAPPIARFWQMESLGGYNRKWGLPTPQAHALRAGSVFVYRARDIDRSKLRHALENGIGERRNDGLGRIAVNWQKQNEVYATKSTSKDPAALPEKPEEKGMAAEIETMILAAAARRRLDHHIARVANRVSINRAPSKAMLSRLMMAARQAAFAQSVKPLARFLLDVRGEQLTVLKNPESLSAMLGLLQNPQKEGASRKPAQVALEKARVGEDVFGKWLEDRVIKRDIETQLQLLSDPGFNQELGGRHFEMTDALREEYTARFIERIVKRAIKAAKEEERS